MARSRWGAALAGLVLGLPGAMGQAPAPEVVTPAVEAPVIIPPEAAAVADPLLDNTGDLRHRLHLTGDWWGARTRLEDRGLTFNFFATQFFQGIASGGKEQLGTFGGKLDYIADVDGEKLGLWKGFYFNFHAETRYGLSINAHDGLLTPTNIPLSFPAENGTVTAITRLKFTQALSENFVVFAGKINTLDEYAFQYSGGQKGNRPGLEGFMNTSLVFNPIVARTVPYSALGVGGAIVSGEEPIVSLSVFDPRERVNDDLSDPYADGVTIVPEVTLKTKLRGLPLMLNFGGTWSNAEYRSFDPAAYLNVDFLKTLQEKDPDTPQMKGSWSLYANFFQSLWVDPNDEKRAWGLFGQFGLSDGNPNPIRYIANGGVGGRSMIPGRIYDTFGAGYFYVGLSNNFKTLAAPYSPQRDEYGVELFYNYAVTPWARFTSDLQVVRPSSVNYNTAIIPGIRLQVLF